MGTLRRSLLAVVLVATLSPVTADAQVIAGTSLFFDHTAEEQAFVASYQLCAGTDCRDIGVTRVGTTATLSLTIPAWVQRGRQELTVRAVWRTPLTGTSAPSNTLSPVVVGGPERFRTTAVSQ